MPRPFEDELQVEREHNSKLGQLDAKIGRRGNPAAKAFDEFLDGDGKAAPVDRGFGAGLLEEQRRARTWKLALGGIILVAFARMVYNFLLS